MSYEATANALVDRIIKQIPKRKLMSIQDPWDLFKVRGFNCDDLQPSLFQAAWAMAQAKRHYKKTV